MICCGYCRQTSRRRSKICFEFTYIYFPFVELFVVDSDLRMSGTNYDVNISSDSCIVRWCPVGLTTTSVCEGDHSDWFSAVDRRTTKRYWPEERSIPNILTSF